MDDKGSVIVEMCLVMPILIGVVFVVINLFVVVMNYSIAAGEAYTVLYNREEYILLGDSDYSDTAEKSYGRKMFEITQYSQKLWRLQQQWWMKDWWNMELRQTRCLESVRIG